MPRHYKRKTKTKYKLEDLEKAIECARNKTLSIGRAAAVYSVPKSTIQDRIKRGDRTEPKSGRKAIFSEDQEKELEEMIIVCREQGLSVKLLRKMAFQFAEANDVKHNFDKVSQMAGKDWYLGFKKRHPNISLRKPTKSTSIDRMTTVDETEAEMFSEHLEVLQDNADCMNNIDETGISNVQRTSEILAPNGQKENSVATSDETGTTTVDLDPLGINTSAEKPIDCNQLKQEATDFEDIEQLTQEQETPSAKQSVQPPLKKKKRNPNDTVEELLGLAADYFSKPESELEVLAKGWAIKLSKLALDQRLYAEKIINDTLFEAQMGALKRNGVRFLPAPESDWHQPSS